MLDVTLTTFHEVIHWILPTILEVKIIIIPKLPMRKLGHQGKMQPVQSSHSKDTMELGPESWCLTAAGTKLSSPQSLPEPPTFRHKGRFQAELQRQIPSQWLSSWEVSRALVSAERKVRQLERKKSREKGNKCLLRTCWVTSSLVGYVLLILFSHTQRH